MSNIKYPFKSQDVSSTGFGKRDKPESDHIPDATKMVDRIPCEKCGEFHTVEVNVATFQGVINECTKLQARVKELEEWKRKAVRFLEMIKQRDYWNPDLYKSDYDELETLLKKEANHE